LPALIRSVAPALRRSRRWHSGPGWCSDGVVGGQPCAALQPGSARRLRTPDCAQPSIACTAAGTQPAKATQPVASSQAARPLLPGRSAERRCDGGERRARPQTRRLRQWRSRGGCAAARTPRRSGVAGGACAGAGGVELGGPSRPQQPRRCVPLPKLHRGRVPGAENALAFVCKSSMGKALASVCLVSLLCQWIYYSAAASRAPHEGCRLAFTLWGCGRCRGRRAVSRCCGAWSQAATCGRYSQRECTTWRCASQLVPAVDRPALVSGHPCLSRLPACAAVRMSWLHTIPAGQHNG